MGLLDIFRRRPLFRDTPALADFIDRSAAFLIQKGMYEYSRARAGHYAKVLFAEPEFLEAIERARWQAFPLGLAMVAEMVDGLLRPHVGEDRRAGLDPLNTLVLSVFDRYGVPVSLGRAAWVDARVDLARRLDLIGLHPPKPVKDIPIPFAELYFGMMPINAKLRAPDFPAIRSYLRVSLINIHDELTRRADIAALGSALLVDKPEL